MNSPRHPLPALLLCGLLLLIPNAPTQAGSATWNVNPATNDWNTATNWTPHTVPNSPGDTATFSTSNVSNPVIHSSVEVSSIVFNGAFTQFTVTAGDAASQNTATLTLSGVGVMNTSSVLLQNLESAPTLATNGATNVISFTNSATLTTTGSTFTHLLAGGGDGVGSAGGQIQFHDNSSLASATTVSNFGQNGGAAGGTFFFNNSTAADGEVVNLSFNGSSPGFTVFQDSATAADAFVRNDGAIVANQLGGQTFFLGSSTAGNSFIDAGGGFTQDDTGAAIVTFSDTATSGKALLESESGASSENGGIIQFTGDSTGGTAHVVLSGSGRLIISQHNPPGITIGSLEGDGQVRLGANALTVGSNNLNSSFGGVIQDTGSLTKTGSGTLTLSGENIYTGGTTIEGGKLLVNNMSGSATGSGAVRVNAGRLGGRGTIAGSVTVGTGGGFGAALGPGRRGGKPDALTIQSTLTFNSDATYTCGLNTESAKADQVVANGVTINGARFSLLSRGGLPLPAGTVLMAINNTAPTSIAGMFVNLPDDSTFTTHGNTFQANYEGGDGNDLTLTVVP